MTDITVENITKSYGGKTVLRHFSARFPAGAVSALTGPSGSGKTTLLRLLLGLETPEEGYIRGVPARLAAVFQEDRLCEGLSAAANLRLVAGRDCPPAAIGALLAELELAESAAQPVRELSGGMKRRAALARALLYEGELLVLDEPFKGLDEALRERAAAVVRRRTVGKTVLLVTHDVREAALLGAETFYTLPALPPE